MLPQQQPLICHLIELSNDLLRAVLRVCLSLFGWLFFK